MHAIYDFLNRFSRVNTTIVYTCYLYLYVRRARVQDGRLKRPIKTFWRETFRFPSRRRRPQRRNVPSQFVFSFNDGPPSKQTPPNDALAAALLALYSPTMASCGWNGVCFIFYFSCNHVFVIFTRIPIFRWWTRGVVSVFVRACKRFWSSIFPPPTQFFTKTGFYALIVI